MWTPVRRHRRFEVDIGAMLGGQSCEERRGRLAAGATRFIRFERQLDDCRDRTALAARDAVREVSGLRIPHRKLGFRHARHIAIHNLAVKMADAIFTAISAMAAIRC
jgi:hypothetical protein